MEITYFIAFFNLIGTVAFALSGAMTAIKKDMDALGVIILGVVTAVGGGILRDIVLGEKPPQALRDPRYAFCAFVVSVFIFLVLYFHVRGYRRISSALFQQILMAADTLGLAVFTVVGVRAVCGNRSEWNYFLPIFLGTITGVGGGLLRDILAGDRPYIFVKHVYACASIAGAFVCTFLWRRVEERWAMLLGALCVILIRLLAIHFRWNLPKIRDGESLIDN